MKSPFPGMDPFLEPYWLGVHPRLVVYAADQIADSLPPDLRAVTQERVLVEAEDEHLRRSFYPDVTISQPRSSVEAGVALVESTETAVAEPLIIRLRDEPVRQSFIEIVDATSGDKVVTVIEFLSPTNKEAGAGRDLYERKQRECVDARVNFVEIDLTRNGERRLLVPPEQVPASHRTVYQVCVWRASRPKDYEVYATSLDRPLPNIRIPLRERDTDVVLRLQPMLDRAYSVGRYDRRIDYSAELDPPLDEIDRERMEHFLKDEK